MEGYFGKTAPVNDSWRAALYLRLSKDDDNSIESASIAGQKKLLTAFAKDNGFDIGGLYIDDGYSGTSFDRPDFLRMISDIKAKKINMVITKDLSRLGRDYITSGHFTEIFFPENNVRYIAINDGYDSVNEFNDIAPFKHVLNEMYARDTSKKIRSAIKTKMQEGSFIGNFAPYGYMKNPENKNQLIVDPESASIVREIFCAACEGKRPSEIADFLNSAGILPPALYRRKSIPHFRRDTSSFWSSSTICKMLSNIVYLGHTAQGKTSKPSLKSKSSVRAPREEWVVVENTHEPIVSQDAFDLVRKRSLSRRNLPVSDFHNVFSGIAKCADCGGNMSTAGGKNGSYKLVCGKYKLYGVKACTNHFIEYQLLYDCILSRVRKLLAITPAQRRRVISAILNKSANKSGIRDETADLIFSLKSRSREIDSIIQRLYEDNIGGKISDDRFKKLSQAYESEQKGILQRIELIEKNDKPVPEPESDEISRKLNCLINTSILTPGIIKRMIERIEISQGHYDGLGKKRRSICIYWSFEES